MEDFNGEIQWSLQDMEEKNQELKVKLDEK